MIKEPEKNKGVSPVDSKGKSIPGSTVGGVSAKALLCSRKRQSPWIEKRQ